MVLKEGKVQKTDLNNRSDTQEILAGMQVIKISAQIA